MDDASLQVNIGTVQSSYGTLSFSFVVRSNGVSFVRVYCSDPSDLRKSGVLLHLDDTEYEKLKGLIYRTDQIIEKFRSSGDMLLMLG